MRLHETRSNNSPQHFVDPLRRSRIWRAARPVAEAELDHMAELCARTTHPNTLLTVARELTDAGVRESFRVIEAQSAGLEQFAIHATPES